MLTPGYLLQNTYGHTDMNEPAESAGSPTFGESTDVEAGDTGQDETEGEADGVNQDASSDQRGEPTFLSSRNGETFEEKQRRLLLKECYRLKNQMTEVRDSIHRPPLKPFTPYLFNSLEPYYNQYLVNYTVGELQENEEDERRRTNYGQRATSLGIVEPQASWKMDNVPGPYSSRLIGNAFVRKKWSGNLSGKDASLGSTRLPPFPKPSFPKINLPQYQPSKMDYSQVLKFRDEMDQEISKLNKKKVQLDYNRTLKDWERMNLTELKELPPYSRYHVNKAIKTYLGTSKGATRAVNSLSKQLEVE